MGRLFPNSSVAIGIWLTHFYILLPGTFWPAGWAEHMLWGSGLPDRVFVPLVLLVIIVANASIWFFILLLVRTLRLPAKA